MTCGVSSLTWKLIRGGLYVQDILLLELIGAIFCSLNDNESLVLNNKVVTLI